MKKEQLLPILTTLLGLIGFGVSGYLALKQLSGAEIGPCPIFGGGCGDVLHSKYSEFLGVPWGSGDPGRSFLELSRPSKTSFFGV